MEDLKDLNAIPLNISRGDFIAQNTAAIDDMKAINSRSSENTRLPDEYFDSLLNDLVTHFDNYQRYAGFMTSQRDLPLVSARQYATSRKIRKKVDSGDYDFVNTGF